MCKSLFQTSNNQGTWSFHFNIPFLLLVCLGIFLFYLCLLAILSCCFSFPKCSYIRNWTSWLNRLIISNIFGNTEDWQCFFSWILVQVSWNTHVPEPWMLHVSLNLPLGSGFPHVGYTCLCLYFRTICISIILVNHLYYIINCISLKFHYFQSNLCPLFNIFKDPFFSLLLFNLHIWVIQLLVGNTQMSTSPC